MLFNALGLNEIFSTNRFFNRANYGNWQRDTEREVDMLQGSFFLTQRSLWEQLGGLDEVEEKWREILESDTEIPVTPYKKDILMDLYGVGWLPYYVYDDGGKQVELAAYA